MIRIWWKLCRQAGVFLTEGPEASCITDALEKIPARRIKEMSEAMLQHRDEVWQDVQTQRLVKIYEEVMGLHKCDTMNV